MTESNEYALWESLLAAKVAGQTPPPIDANEPAVGFYRSRRKGQPYVPVSIWREEGVLCAQYDLQDVATTKIIDAWPFISKNPVSFQEYEFYRENKRWEDADETVHEQATERGMGDNNPPDELTLMKEQIDAASAGIAAYVEITDDVTQAKAQSLRSRLLELSAGADKKREAEKKPHWDAGKTVDTKWKPLIDAAKAAADTIRASMAKWETAKATKAREAIERIARQRATEAVMAGNPAPPPLPPQPLAPQPLAPQPIKGAYGRAASAKPVKVVKRITDIDAALKFFRDTPEIHECVLKIAKSYCKNYPETELPGIETAMEMDVR